MEFTGNTHLKPLATSFELDEDLILFTPRSGDLFLLNPTAALIWEGLADGLGLDDIIDTLAAVAGRPREDVVADCDSLIADWHRTGILDGGEPRTAADTVPAKPWWSDEVRATTLPDFQPSRVRDYQLVDFQFRLRTGHSAVDEQVHDLLAHVEAQDSDPAGSTLDVFPRNGQWCMYYNGHLVDRCPEQEGVVPMVHGNLMVAAYRRSQCLVALHAAAVTKNGRGVLLAGVPGSGKSTLTCALLARGFGYCADDTALLTAPPMRVRGVPTRLGLKEGSWPVVRELWPEVDTLPIYRRADGKRVRYLLPQVHLPAARSGKAQTAHVLVFPSYQKDSSTIMRPLRRADALLKLTRSGYDIPDVINEEIVSVMIDWMTSLTCYELQYSDMNEAVEEIGGAVA